MGKERQRGNGFYFEFYTVKKEWEFQNSLCHSLLCIFPTWAMENYLTILFIFFRDKNEENNLLKTDADDNGDIENEISSVELNPHFMDYDLLIKEDTDSENDSGTNSSEPEKKGQKCQYCQKWSNDLDRHTCEGTRLAYVPCPCCEKTFKAMRTLRKHINKVHSFYKISENNKASTTTYQKHGPKNKKCNLCEESFESDRRLMNHCAQVHEGQKSLLPCDSCDKTFAFKQSLQKHVKLVHQGIRFKCNHCENKVYSDERRLKGPIIYLFDGRSLSISTFSRNPKGTFSCKYIRYINAIEESEKFKSSDYNVLSKHLYLCLKRALPSRKCPIKWHAK